MLNKLKPNSNMYGFVTSTWNTISGRCNHSCIYCYNLGRPFFDGALRLMEKNFKDNLGENGFIFVGSSNDLFQSEVPDEWIIRTLEHCKKYPKNRYLFQSKNPGRMAEFLHLMPDNSVYATTIETNRDIKLGDAPSCYDRIYYFSSFPETRMITLEPLCDFDLDELKAMIMRCRPSWVNIGSDSKGHNLPEPTKEKINMLIKELEQFTKVIQKHNLGRLL